MKRMALLIFLAAATLSRAAEKPLNFVVVLVDDMGWTDLECSGSRLYETPHLNQLAKEGVRFTQGYAACTVCSPTRAAMLTGKYPARLHITNWIPGHRPKNVKFKDPDWTQHLPLTETTIARLLKGVGYATCHIGKWHLGSERFHPDKHGFDHNIGGTHRGGPRSYFSPYRNPNLKDGPRGEYLTDREAIEACHFIEKNKNRPFFLYLPHYAVHTPIQGKKKLTEKYQKKIKPGMKQKNATYAAMVESVDDAMGKIRAKLKSTGVADRTVIIFTSDNGGQILRRPKLPPTDNTPLRAGKGSTYEGGVRVPWIVYWPGVTPKGKVCTEPIITMDCFPTILEIANVQSKLKHDGVSLGSLFKDPSAKLKRESIFWHFPHYHPGGATPYSAIRSGDWKLIEFFEDDHVELYNLKSDLSEKTDLSKKMPMKAKQLQAKLRRWRKSVGAQMPVLR